MQKLLNGIVDFRKNSLENYRANFSRLVKGQSPDALMIACCDSRVAPNVFASSNPGDLFVVRNIGNLVCPCHITDPDSQQDSTAAAIEFALHGLNVKDIVICGHSECAAISAVINGRRSEDEPHMQSWLRYAEPSYARFKAGFTLNSGLPVHNEVSQINVIQQLDHLKTYSLVKQHMEKGTLRVHGWWFDLATANVYYFDDLVKEFLLIDETSAAKILDKKQ
jgi:carbonic anhydrase